MVLPLLAAAAFCAGAMLFERSVNGGDEDDRDYSDDRQPESSSYDYSEPEQEAPRKEKKGKKQKEEKFRATPENYAPPERARPNFNGDRKAERAYEILKARDPRGAELVERYLAHAYTADVPQTAVYSAGGRKGGFYMRSDYSSRMSAEDLADTLDHEAAHMENSHKHSHGIPGSTSGHCQEDELYAFREQARCARAMGREGRARWAESHDGNHVYLTETESW